MTIKPAIDLRREDKKTAYNGANYHNGSSEQQQVLSLVLNATPDHTATGTIDNSSFWLII